MLCNCGSVWMYNCEYMFQNICVIVYLWLRSWLIKKGRNKKEKEKEKEQRRRKRKGDGQRTAATAFTFVQGANTNRYKYSHLYWAHLYRMVCTGWTPIQMRLPPDTNVYFSSTVCILINHVQLFDFWISMSDLAIRLCAMQLNTGRYLY
jgi:hypothetical protein